MKNMVVTICASLSILSIIHCASHEDASPKKYTNGILTILHGIITKNSTGSLECKVAYDSVNVRYCGILIHTDHAKSSSSFLNNQQAEEYYKLFMQQLSDKKSGHCRTGL